MAAGSGRAGLLAHFLPGDESRRFLLPRQTHVDLPVHHIAVLPLGLAEAAGITTVEGDVRLGTQLLHHGIKSICWPVKQMTETVDSDLVVAMSQASV